MASFINWVSTIDSCKSLAKPTLIRIRWTHNLSVLQLDSQRNLNRLTFSNSQCMNAVALDSIVADSLNAIALDSSLNIKLPMPTAAPSSWIG
eukprot:4819991-Amphidinium_carterae.1